MKYILLIATCICLTLTPQVIAQEPESGKPKFVFKKKPVPTNLFNRLINLASSHFLCGYVGRYGIGNTFDIATEEHLQAGRNLVELLVSFEVSSANSVNVTKKARKAFQSLEKGLAEAIRKDFFNGRNEESVLSDIGVASPKEKVERCSQLFPIYARTIDEMQEW